MPTDISRVRFADLPVDTQHLCHEAYRIVARSKIMPPWIQALVKSRLVISHYGMEKIFDHDLADTYPLSEHDLRATYEVLYG